jgi:signal transduction histidine kinase
MYKERAEVERKMAAANRKAQEDILQTFLIFSCFVATMIPIFFLSLVMLSRS